MTNVAVLAPAIDYNRELDAALSRIDGYDRGAFYDKGMELKGIRDQRLYRDRHQTFEAFCEAELDRTPQHVNRTIAAAECAEQLEPIGSSVPTRESHVRPLLSLDSTEERATAWNSALDSAKTDGRRVKASDVEAAVSRHREAAQRDWLTLDEWNALSESEQSAALTVRGDKSFNRQDTANIEWARWSWNPVTGCKHDCPYCYARDIAQRFYPQGFEPSLHPARLGAPVATSVPAQAMDDVSYRNVFTCSMADLFGRWVPPQWIESVFGVVRDSPQWNFLFLTKFPKRMVEFDYPQNAWLGTSVDCQARVKAAEDAFENVSSGTKWLSVEPMLEPLKFERLHLFDWIVIGGASKSNITPAWTPPFDWIVDLHVQAREAGCAIYYKTNAFVDGEGNESSRLREFPWQAPVVASLPDSLRYLGMKPAP